MQFLGTIFINEFAAFMLGLSFRKACRPLRDSKIGIG